jgi:uncharacterized protein YjiS (DUF1127 family)
MTTTCSTVAPVPTQHRLYRSWPRRCGDVLWNAWRAWREEALRQAGLRVLEGLSDRTLHDIGLAERALPQPPAMSLRELERSRW